MKALVLVLLILSACGGSGPRDARISVVAATGKNGFSCQETYNLFDSALKEFEAAGLYLVAKDYRCQRNPFQVTEDNWEASHSKWLNEVSKTDLERVVVITSPVLTPTGHFGNYGICETDGRLAVSTAMPKDEFGNDKTESSLRLVVHELGHLLGASHDFTSNNFMGNGGEGDFVGWSQKTIKELEKWQS